MEFTRCYLKQGKWHLRKEYGDEVELAFSGPVDSVLYDETGKAVHLVRRWQPKTLAKAMEQGARYDLDQYSKAITGIDEKACDQLIAGLKLSQ